MNESCDISMSHVWMSHMTYEWVMSWKVLSSRRAHTHEWVMSHMNESCHIWMNHVTHMNESCHPYEWIMSYQVAASRRARRLQCLSESQSPRAYSDAGTIYEWVMSPICLRHDTYINESCHTWMSHVTHEWVMSHMNESCHTWKSRTSPALTPTQVTVEFIYGTWLIHTRAWHDSFICVTRCIHSFDSACSYVWYDSFICVTSLRHNWFIHICVIR